MIKDRTRPTSLRGLSAVALSIVLLGAACGGATSTPPATRTPGAVATAAATAAPTATPVPYPTKPVTFVVGFAAGSGGDLAARLHADILATKTGQRWIVENKTAGSGAEALTYLASQPADGYTIGVWTASVAGQIAAGDLPFKVDDFAYIVRLTSAPFKWCVPTASPIKSFADFVARAKAGRVNVAGPGTGSASHIGALKFAKLAGIQFTWVPFPGSAEVNAAVLGGHTDLGYGSCRVDGLRSLAIASFERSKFDADVPTMKESGYNMEDTQWRGFVVKAGTAPSIVSRLEALFLENQKDPKVIDFGDKQREDTLILRTQEFTESVRKEVADGAAIRKELGLK